MNCRFVVFALLAALFTGCEYDRSFLQMSSDSGSPFMGLQLRVDARDSAIQQRETTEPERIQIASADDTEELPEHSTIQQVSGIRSKSRFVPTASAHPLTTSVRYTLPAFAPGSAPGEESDYDRITERQHAF